MEQQTSTFFKEHLNNSFSGDIDNQLKSSTHDMRGGSLPSTAPGSTSENVFKLQQVSSVPAAKVTARLQENMSTDQLGVLSFPISHEGGVSRY